MPDWKSGCSVTWLLLVPWSQKLHSHELPADLLWVATRVPDKLICSSCSFIFYLPCYLIDPGCAWSCKRPSWTLQHMLYILHALLYSDKEHKNQRWQERRGGRRPQSRMNADPSTCLRGSLNHLSLIAPWTKLTFFL